MAGVVHAVIYENYSEDGNENFQSWAGKLLNDMSNNRQFDTKQNISPFNNRSDNFDQILSEVTTPKYVTNPEKKLDDSFVMSSNKLNTFSQLFGKVSRNDKNLMPKQSKNREEPNALGIDHLFNSKYAIDETARVKPSTSIDPFKPNWNKHFNAHTIPNTVGEIWPFLSQYKYEPKGNSQSSYDRHKPDLFRHKKNRKHGHDVSNRVTGSTSKISPLLKYLFNTGTYRYSDNKVYKPPYPTTARNDSSGLARGHYGDSIYLNFEEDENDVNNYDVRDTSPGRVGAANSLFKRNSRSRANTYGHSIFRGKRVSGPTRTNISCSPPERAAFASVKVIGENEEAVAIYECLEGYFGTTAMYRKCSRYGEWEGNLPRCVKCKSLLC